MFERISAITLATRDMGRAVAFYRDLGFEPVYGGAESDFTSLGAGEGFVNLVLVPAGTEWRWWGRVIVHVRDVDEMHRRALAAGHRPHAAPRDAPWGERFFHLTDPDGHELSFARPLR